jgi:hypothetical protein
MSAQASVQCQEVQFQLRKRKSCRFWIERGNNKLILIIFFLIKLFLGSPWKKVTKSQSLRHIMNIMRKHLNKI